MNARFAFAKSLRQRFTNRRRFFSPQVEALEDRTLLANWSGAIPNGTVWSNNEVQVIVGDASVSAGSTLTIQPGTVVKFQTGAAKLSLVVNGTLTADGTPGQRILFTSTSDDTGFDGVAGTADDQDTNGNGASLGAKGDWSRIYFDGTGSNSSLMDNVEVRFGGSGVGQVYLRNSAATISNSILRNSNLAGIELENSTPTLTSNTYRDNTGPAILMDAQSDPAISGVTMSNNGTNGLKVYGSPSTSQNTVWNDPDVVYVIDSFQAANNRTVTIGAGQVVKVTANSSFYFNNTTNLLLDGTAAQPVTFTSIKDDSVGGDTNNDGNATAPSKGDWIGIELRGTAALDYARIHYAGRNGDYGAIYLNQFGNISISNSIISDSAAIGGLYIFNGLNSPTVTGTTFENNTNAAILMENDSNPSISNITLTNNGINGLSFIGGLPTDRDSVWDDTDIVYVLSGPVTVPTGRKLTISPGQIIKFHGPNAFKGFDVYGNLTANGTAERPIVFTSSKDDSVGGDTNNDGSATAPANGEWQGFYFRNANASGTMSHARVRYGGSDASYAAVFADVASTLSVYNTEISNSKMPGLRSWGATITSVNNIIRNGSEEGLLVSHGGSITAINNTIDGNKRGVVQEGSTITLTNSLVTFHSDVGLWNRFSGTSNLSHNIVHNPGATNGNYRELTDPTGTNGNLSADPLYANRGAADYRPGPSSPAVDSATSTGAPATDYFGNSRFDDPNVANTGSSASAIYDRGAIERRVISPPSADILDVTPDPRNSSIGNVFIEFSDDVTGVDIADFRLQRNGNVVGLNNLSVVSETARRYRIDLSSVTSSNGSYELTLLAANSGIQSSSSSGLALAGDASDTWIVDTTTPVVTVNSLTTNDTTPAITGTVSEGALQVIVNGKTYTAGDGNLSVNGTNWTLQIPAGDALASGTYNVQTSATDLAGNIGNDGTTNELVINTAAPVVTVTPLATADTTPLIAGTVSGGTLSVIVNGKTYNAGDGKLSVNGTTWSLQIPAADALAEGVYNVQASATDRFNNTGNDATTNELLIDFTAPVVTVNSQTTNDTTPAITGTVSQGSLQVIVNGKTYTAGDGRLTVNGASWSLQIPVGDALPEGVFNVQASSTDAAGNVGSDATTNELVIDTTAPAVTVSALTTNSATPAITGTVSSGSLQVSVNGKSYTAGDGKLSVSGTNWTLQIPAGDALAAGTYSVTASATDAAGNVGTDATADELTVLAASDLIEVTVRFADGSGNAIDPASGLPIGQAFRIYVYAQDLRTTGTDKGVASAFADLLFNTSLIDVTRIVPVFNDFTSGTIDDAGGTVEEVGGLENTRPSTRDPQPVFYLEATAAASGSLTVTPNVPESAFSENTLFGVDGDQRSRTRYVGSQIGIGRPDLIGAAFDALPDHVLAGKTAVNLTVKNQGDSASGAFDVRIVLSDDATIGNADDVTLTTSSFTSLAAGASSGRTVMLDLPRATLYAWALRDDPPATGLNLASNDAQWLGMIIDPTNAVAEGNDANNLNRGKGLDKDDITYFPWDVNGNGSVGPSDAVFIINRLGQTSPPADAKADLNGDGNVTPTEAVAVINRIGYLRNSAVIEAAPGSSAGAADDELPFGPQPLSDADSSSAAEGESSDLIDVSIRFTDLAGMPIEQVIPLQIFHIEVFAQDLRTDGDRPGVTSLFADVTFDTDLIDVTNLMPAFDDFSTGTIDDQTGLVDEAGGFENTMPADRSPQLVFVLEATATSAGTLHVASNPGDSVFSENTLLGLDGDQRMFTRYGQAELLIVEATSAPWRNAVTAFDVNADGDVTASDVMALANYLNANGSGPLPNPPLAPTTPPPFVDVNGDNLASPFDAILLINFINTGLGLPGEAESAASASADRLAAARRADAALAEFDLAGELDALLYGIADGLASD